MTAPAVATVNQALLALYGALDRAVTGNHGAGVEQTVERYLPGSTGANAGWYDELLGFLQHSPGAGPREEGSATAPELSDALTVLQAQKSPPDEEDDANSLSAVQLSRMVYAIGALSQLPMYQGLDEWDAQFSRTLQVVSPLLPSSESKSGTPAGNGLLALLRSAFHERDDFPSVMRSAVRQNLIDGKVATVPLCDLKSKWVHGHLSAVLTTEFESSDVSLVDIKNVVDPLNWHRCLSFFCAMDPKPTRADGWHRVLEHVSTTCPITGTPQMVTPLKYWKGPSANQPPVTAYLNYALDDDPVPDGKGDGRVVVDEGFIRMNATSEDPASRGVRVRTRKVVAFHNLSWIAGAIFACSMGYGYEGMDMLIGGVSKRAQNTQGWKDWEPSAAPPHDGSPGHPGEPDQSPDPSRRAVEVAIEMANECIDHMSAKSAAIAAKLAAGQVPIEETIAYGTDLAVRLATDPWRYLERLRNPTQGNDT